MHSKYPELDQILQYSTESQCEQLSIFHHFKCTVCVCVGGGYSFSFEVWITFEKPLEGTAYLPLKTALHNNSGENTGVNLHVFGSALIH